VLTASDRIALLMHEGLQGAKGKTGISLLRYSELSIVAVIDEQSPGRSLSELIGISRPVPIVASIAEALDYQPTVLMIGPFWRGTT
jgi:uncharacterized NAD-dependent epimerase/dehydratase family protein